MECFTHNGRVEQHVNIDWHSFNIILMTEQDIRCKGCVNVQASVNSRTQVKMEHWESV